MNIKIIGQYEIESGDDCKHPLYPYWARLINNNCKSYNAIKENYMFKTEEEQKRYIDDKIAGIKAHNDRKAKRKAERMAFKNPAKVGDILYSSWGYDQTNVDFYQVTKVTKKMAYFVKIGGKYTNDRMDRVKPVKNAFKEGAKVRRGLVQGGWGDDKSQYYINLNSYSSAHLTDENKEHYQTDPYSGH